MIKQKDTITRLMHRGLPGVCGESAGSVGRSGASGAPSRYSAGGPSSTGPIMQLIHTKFKQSNGKENLKISRIVMYARSSELFI